MAEGEAEDSSTFEDNSQGRGERALTSEEKEIFPAPQVSLHRSAKSLILRLDEPLLKTLFSRI